jgi:transglutaminase-like putative cysteine protease
VTRERPTTLFAAEDVSPLSVTRHGDAFLAETRFCDFSHPEIDLLATTFARRGRSDRELVVEVFEFAQDAIAYEVGNWQRTASQTLQRRKGTCTNSANLMVAVLRRLGVPAGYGVMTVNGREYLGPAIPRRLADRVAEKSRHIYACVMLEDRWLRCDPSDDKALSAASGHLNPQCTPIVFDGYGDALLKLDPGHVHEDRFPIADIDAVIDKPMRLAMRLPALVGNHFIDFLREQGHSMRDCAEVELRFDEWLAGRHPVCHRLYRMLPGP